MQFFISINYFRVLGTGSDNKAFSPRIIINILKMVTNMKVAFTSSPFRRDSACVIQKSLRL